MSRRGRGRRTDSTARRIGSTRAGRNLTGDELSAVARDARSDDPARYRRMRSTAWGGAMVIYPIGGGGVNTYSVGGEPGRRCVTAALTCRGCGDVAAVLGRPNDTRAVERVGTEVGVVAGTGEHVEWIDGPALAVWCPDCADESGRHNALVISAVQAQNALDTLADEVGPNLARHAVWKFPER